jgi:nicotinamidase-related amidase
MLLFFQISFSQDASIQNENTASILLVLDVQEHFVDNMMKRNEGAELVESVNEIIQLARPMDIVFIKANIKVLELSLKKGFKVIQAENLDLASTLYRKKNDRIFMKEEGSAFSSGDFQQYLEDNHIGKVYLVGLFASECISATCIKGEEIGYEMILVEDGIAARKAKKKDKILAKLLENGADIINLSAFEDQME